VDLTPDAVATVRVSGGVGAWSPAAARITGRGRKDVVRAGLASVFRDPRDLDRLLGLAARRGRVVAEDVVLLGPSGAAVPVRAFATSLAGRAPGPERALLLFHDLTEVHRIRRRLIETEKLSAMAKIAASVAHEFRNPLNSLFLSADLLEDELTEQKALGRGVEATLAAIREEVERLDRIITHYLSLSKIGSAAPEAMDLAGAVQEFAAEWRERAKGRGAALGVRTDRGPARICADPNQVRRVLVNLVENALDALDVLHRGGGRGSRAARPGRVTLAVRRMRRCVKMTVRDNGCGIPREVRAKAFEPFTTSKAGGSGLGLYVVREIVLAHGGAIALSTSSGRGTSVCVRWPRPRPPAERPEKPEGPP
jgi:signal transduction histidine kinase